MKDAWHFTVLPFLEHRADNTYLHYPYVRRSTVVRDVTTIFVHCEESFYLLLL